MNLNNKLISVKGRERPLSKKQKQSFLLLSRYALNLSLFKDKEFFKKNKICLEIGFGSGEIIFQEAKKNPKNSLTSPIILLYNNDVVGHVQRGESYLNADFLPQSNPGGGVHGTPKLKKEL